MNNKYPKPNTIVYFNVFQVNDPEIFNEIKEEEMPVAGRVYKAYYSKKKDVYSVFVGDGITFNFEGDSGEGGPCDFDISEITSLNV